MWRYYYTIVRNIFRIPKAIKTMQDMIELWRTVRKAGCFKIWLKSNVPIISVVLIDSYKPYNSWDIGEIRTQIHYLKPIFFDEYKDMNTQQIAELVKGRISDKIKEVKKDVKL